jgi:uncharacterized membrane protein YfcA
VPGEANLIWIGVAIFLLGMSKGGLPVAPVVLPLLILVWADQASAARDAVGFMLPVLCAMDLVALAFYRRRIEWPRLRTLWPGMVAGVAVASALFVSDASAAIAVSDRALKLLIGALGLAFVAHRAAQTWWLKKLHADTGRSWRRGTLYGFASGVTSTLAHAAGPVMQMYLLPQKLDKLVFAGTTAAFFFVLNLVKVVPFALLGRLKGDALLLGVKVLPIAPVGVAVGYAAVRVLKPRHYVGIIYALLAITSVLLVWKALHG